MNITIKGDANTAKAIAEGISTTQLRIVQAECARMKAINGVRSEADKKRWERTRRKLARKYKVKPAGRVGGAILGVYALTVLAVHRAYDYLSGWNRA